MRAATWPPSRVPAIPIPKVANSAPSPCIVAVIASGASPWRAPRMPWTIPQSMPPAMLETKSTTTPTNTALARTELMAASPTGIGSEGRGANLTSGPRSP